MVVTKILYEHSHGLWTKVSHYWSLTQIRRVSADKEQCRETRSFPGWSDIFFNFITTATWMVPTAMHHTRVWTLLFYAVPYHFAVTTRYHLTGVWIGLSHLLRGIGTAPSLLAIGDSASECVHVGLVGNFQYDTIYLLAAGKGPCLHLAGASIVQVDICKAQA